MNAGNLKTILRTKVWCGIKAHLCFHGYTLVLTESVKGFFGAPIERGQILDNCFSSI